MRFTAFLTLAAALPWMIAMVSLCRHARRRRAPALMACARRSSAAAVAGDTRMPLRRARPMSRNTSQRCAMPHIAAAR
ncbi:hypothetical protein [Phreatobacter stygius]|uniref:Uncharacterized protein n=1 Tax=Phreatobacter stygius TaxID=1940610 RepID=A0A4D7B218_9HYPH|nr:hypothetical protein [Phreatobacter stygius]QCI64100.1 hypothetical protein E8M01_07485 [Phreatobacter stygius]